MAKKPKKKIPKKEPKKFWFNYRELVDEYSNWGREVEGIKCFREAKKSPSDADLQFAFLVKIVDLLREIRDEVKRDRKIT